MLADPRLGRNWSNNGRFGEPAIRDIDFDFADDGVDALEHE
jgi:hypothetical protein